MRLESHAFLIAPGRWLGALVLAALAGGPAAAQNAGEIAFAETFESGTLGALGTSGNSPQVTKESPRAGQWAMKSYVDRLSDGNNFRTEARIPGTQDIGGEYWLGFSVRVPTDWKPDNLANAVVFQAHDSVFPSDKNPMFAIRATPLGRWRVTGLYISEANASKEDQMTAFNQDIGDIVPGRWTDFVIHYKWAYDHSQGGFTKVWMDGDLVLDYKGPNCYNDPTGPFWKFGLYVGLWRRDNEHSIDHMTIFHDEVRIANAPSDYVTVAPQGANPKSPAAPPVIEVE